MEFYICREELFDVPLFFILPEKDIYFIFAHNTLESKCISDHRGNEQVLKLKLRPNIKSQNFASLNQKFAN